MSIETAIQQRFSWGRRAAGAGVAALTLTGCSLFGGKPKDGNGPLPPQATVAPTAPTILSTVAPNTPPTTVGAVATLPGTTRATIPEVPFSIDGRVLKYETPQMHGSDVAQAQTWLNQIGCSALTPAVIKLNVDEYFGPKSEAVVHTFQSKHPELQNDGLAGPATQTLLVHQVNAGSTTC